MLGQKDAPGELQDGIGDKNFIVFIVTMKLS